MFKSQERITKQLSHIMGVFKESECKIRPHFFLTGPSGSGKSYLTYQSAKEMGIPFLELNAAQLTAEGLSGNSLSKALRPLRNHWNEPNIVFVDEFDKLFQRNGEKTEDFRNMVQDEFLTALESQYTSIFTDYGKYEPVRISNSLFIFAGAFSNQKIHSLQDLRDAGIRTEFVGRVPLVFWTEDVPMSELKKAIPNLSLFKEYLNLYPRTNKTKAIGDIMKMVEEQNKDSSIGIRLLNSTIHQYFMKDI